MEMNTTTETIPSVPPFAPPPFKKRKFIRRRNEGDDSNDSETITTKTATTITAAAAQIPLSPSPPAHSPQPSEENSDAPNLSEILRLRKKITRTSTRRGLEVTAPKPIPITISPTATHVPEDDAAAKEAAEEAELQAVVNRFTHQTGQILDVDKHMMAYIDSEMQRRRGIAGASAQGGDGTNIIGDGSNQTGENQNRSAYWTPVVPEGRGATLGKLHEVDLGEETKKRNIARTQEATRRLQGDGSAVEVEEEEAVGGGGKKKVKGRRRRNSQDIQRDKLVEEVLKESRRMFFSPFLVHRIHLPLHKANMLRSGNVYRARPLRRSSGNRRRRRRSHR